ncbi:hypothetical protein [Parasphingopyxis lamellibrachiae]|uniref:hypothetical protein n=1 Tax=Parasphingopyxis lamellibrachiae TaxID=680125 RepID=UPI000E25E87A|nr:hypothetical protein [Parasphingopyxis lamellibrachiae]
MRGWATIIALGLCFLGSPGNALQMPPQPSSPPPPPPLQQPPPSQDDGNRPPRDPSANEPEGAPRLSWYNGDYVAKSIASVTTIDDPVIGFGNEALWTSPPSLPAPDQSDVAGPVDPD